MTRTEYRVTLDSEYKRVGYKIYEDKGARLGNITAIYPRLFLAMVERRMLIVKRYTWIAPGRRCPHKRITRPREAGNRYEKDSALVMQLRETFAKEIEGGTLTLIEG